MSKRTRATREIQKAIANAQEQNSRETFHEPQRARATRVRSKKRPGVPVNLQTRAGTAQPSVSA